ncbi:acyl-CoA dehydrogenase family protein [uncultured Desulfobacter sp.]|uniref:acyl-CoA dehydrogenase family protein n=1 Tax=uncultured Desulfobacter sp. TaxID=240139 RepID=UPI0029F4EE08|nr:acyl-CoA dehydrogenase family protein [uncultured Desulfobacter sp.]
MNKFQENAKRKYSGPPQLSPPPGETHVVFNQPCPLEPYNAYLSDTALKHWVKVFGGDWHRDALSEYGEKVGSSLYEAGFVANKFKPEFKSHDRFGKRIDQVDYHPAYHQLMDSGITAGHHSLPWTNRRMGAHVARSALAYMHTQADPGSGCPLTMTFASVPAISHEPDLAALWLPKITAEIYDPRNIPFFEKKGLTIGMAMTEKQGGSDVRANTTRAYPINDDGPGRSYELHGHKWFCSAPMCDAFLVLAYSHDSTRESTGLSCFLMPRWRPDGTKNQIFFQRIKDKMGNVSNASGEVEYRGAFAWMIGPEGRGVRTIIEMVSMTRFDCMVGSSAIMRQALAQAVHHSGGREAFGKNLHQQPLMKNVLADLALESEAVLAISMRVAHSLDIIQNDPKNRHEHLLSRIATAIGKYWICKRSAQFTYECMECIGGVGVVEDNILPRLYRESPINAIWEGSGNIQCLDVLRVLNKNPSVLESFIAELGLASGRFQDFDCFVNDLPEEFSDTKSLEFRARTVVEKLAIAWQASTLIQFADPVVAQAFMASRISRPHAQYYGTLPEGIDCDYLIRRVFDPAGL